MSDKEIADAMYLWELAESRKRKASPGYENAQEKAEMAIMLGNDYESADHRQKP